MVESNIGESVRPQVRIRKPMRGKKRNLKGLDLKYLCLRVPPEVHAKLCELAGQKPLAEIIEAMTNRYHRLASKKVTDSSAYLE
jgi:hypothetical protein